LIKHFVRKYKDVIHTILGSENDQYVCRACGVKSNHHNFHIASALVDKKTQAVYKRLKRKCKNCENKIHAIRVALRKDDKTPPKTDYCQHCGRTDCKIGLHHNHLTGEFVRWACVNCNSRFVHDTLEEHVEDAERWYRE